MDTILLILFWHLYIIIWLGILFNREYYKKSFKTVHDHSLLILISSILAFIAGFFILLYYNVFSGLKQSLILIFWLLSCLKWVINIIFPDISTAIMKRINKKNLLLESYFMIIFWTFILSVAIL